MEQNVLTSLLSLIGTLVGTLGGILVSQRLTNFRLEQLEREVREHNNFARRMPVVEEQIRVANHRIADLEQKAERKPDWLPGFPVQIYCNRRERCEREADETAGCEVACHICADCGCVHSGHSPECGYAV